MERRRSQIPARYHVLARPLTKPGGGLITKRRVLLTALAMAALAAGAGYLLLPRPGEFLRQQVERGLAKKLEAEVSLGRFTIQGTRRFLLNDLEIRTMAGQPRLGSLIAAEVQVEGGVPDILEGHFERIKIRSLDVRIQEPQGPPASGPPAEFSSRTLEVQNGRVFFPGDSPAIVAFSAGLAGIGTKPSGEIRLDAPQLDLAPVGRLAAELTGLTDPGLGGRVRVFEGRLTKPEGSEGWTVLFTAEEVAARLEGRPRLPVLRQPHLEVAVRENTYHIETRTGMEDGGRVVAQADLDGQGHPGMVTLRALRVNLETWSDWLRELTPGVSATGILEVEVTHQPDSAWEFQVRGTVSAEAEDQGALRDVALDLSGSFDSIEPLAPVALLGSVDIKKGFWNAGHLPVENLFPLHLALDGRVSARSAPGFLGSLAATTAQDGQVAFQGLVSLEEHQPRVKGSWTWDEGKIERLAAWAGTIGETLPKAKGKVNARGTLDGMWPHLAADADLFWNDVQAEEGEPFPLEIKEGEGKAKLQWKNGLEVRELETGGMVRALGLAPLSLKVKGRGFWDPTTGKAQLYEGELTLPDSEPWRFSGVREEKRARGNLDVARVSLPPWRERLLPLIGELWGAGSFEGSAGLQAEGQWSEEEGWGVSGTGILAGVGWSSSDGASVVQGPEVTFQFQSQGGPEQGVGPRGRLAADWKNFQVLRGGFFGDFSAVHGTLNLDWDMRGDHGTARFDLAVPEAFEVRGEAQGDRQTGLRIARATLEAPHLGTAFRDVVQIPLADAVPVLGRMTVEGGLSVEGAWERAHGVSVARGRVLLHDARVAGAREAFEVESLNLDLPFDVSFPLPGDVPAVETPLTGTIRFAGLRAGGVDIPGLSAVLTTSGDSLGVGAAVAIPLFGGGMMLDHLYVKHILRPDRKLEFDLILSGMSLEEVTRDLGFLPLSGELEARFKHVSLSAEKLEVDGGSEVDVFGGTIFLHSISGSDILTRYPKVNFEVDFRDIDLGQVTRTFDFGEMTGLISGWAHQVELFGWVPVKFTAQVATVSRRGVPRTINVKAINNVAILGTGSRITLLDRGLQRFFRHYTYDALGLSLSLNNDVFLLRGLEHRGPRELFLRGRLPFPIDVVNADPGKTVSFRAMLDRFQALEVKSVRVGRAR